LVAEAFRPSVTSMVLWLRDYELDIGCIEVSARLLPDGNAVLTSRQLLPLPVAEDYLVQRRRRERIEERREASGRRPNVVTTLLAANVIEPGTELELKLGAFTQAQWELVEREIQQTPDLGVAEWTGLSLSKALKWRQNSKTYSTTGLVLRILEQCGYKPQSVAGPIYWTISDGRTLFEVENDLSPTQVNQSLAW
jgi:hypothetical protein